MTNRILCDLTARRAVDGESAELQLVAPVSAEPPTAAETKYRGARIAFQGTIHIDADAGTDIIGAEKEDGVGACIKPSQVQERFFPGAGLPGSVLRPVADRMTEPSPQRPR